MKFLRDSISFRFLKHLNFFNQKVRELSRIQCLKGDCHKTHFFALSLICQYIKYENDRIPFINGRILRMT